MHNHGTLEVAGLIFAGGTAYTFKSDSNAWLDPDRPTTCDVIGGLAVRIPQGGIWLERATSPPGLAALAFLLMVGGGTIVEIRRRRRKGTMSRPITRPSRPSGTALDTAPPWLRVALAATALTGIVGLALAAAAWQSPVMAQVTTQTKADRAMTFSYTTSVPRTLAYDDTTVDSPDPVFRTVAKTVDVHFSYRGIPGTVVVSAELSTPSGWHSTVPLSARRTITTTRYNGTVRLDLAALEARSQAAAIVTGMPASPLTVTVRPLMTTAGAAQFAPALRLSLTPLQLTLADGPKDLAIDDSVTMSQVTTVPRTIGTDSLHVTMTAARSLSMALLGAALLAGALLAPIAFTPVPTSEGAGIRRRYGPLLISVEPMATPPDRPPVDVAEFATLAPDAPTPGAAEVQAPLLPTQQTRTSHRAGAHTAKH